jgi:hypothetical protein
LNFFLYQSSSLQPVWWTTSTHHWWDGGRTWWKLMQTKNLFWGGSSVKCVCGLPRHVRPRVPPGDATARFARWIVSPSLAATFVDKLTYFVKWCLLWFQIRLRPREHPIEIPSVSDFNASCFNRFCKLELAHYNFSLEYLWMWRQYRNTSCI